jgi:hypothetical protein
MRRIKILARDRTQNRCLLLLIARSALCAMMPPRRAFSSPIWGQGVSRSPHVTITDRVGAGRSRTIDKLPAEMGEEPGFGDVE